MTTQTVSSTAMRQGIETLRHVTVERLRHKYREAFGQSSRSNHKQFLLRPIACRMEASAYGGLSQHRAAPIEDPRLPMPGTRLMRRYGSALVALTLLLHASIGLTAEMLETRNVVFDRTRHELAFDLYNPTPKIATAWSVIELQTRADGTQISICQTRDALFAADAPQNGAHHDGRLLPFQSKHLAMAANADSVSATVAVVATIWEDLTATGDPSLIGEIAQGRKETARELNETLQMLRSIRDAPDRQAKIHEYAGQIASKQIARASTASHANGQSEVPVHHQIGSKERRDLIGYLEKPGSVAVLDKLIQLYAERAQRASAHAEVKVR